jgi:hypothetical protein
MISLRNLWGARSSLQSSSQKFTKKGQKLMRDSQCLFEVHWIDLGVWMIEKCNRSIHLVRGIIRLKCRGRNRWQVLVWRCLHQIRVVISSRLTEDMNRQARRITTCENNKINGKPWINIAWTSYIIQSQWNTQVLAVHGVSRKHFENRC